MFPSPKAVISRRKRWFCALLLLVLSVSGFAIAEPASTRRFTMGIYFPSLTNQVSLVDVQSAIDFWLNEFAPTFNLLPTARMFQRMDEMRQAFEAGELDFILAPPILLVQYIDQSKLANGFYGTSEGSGNYGSVLLIRKDAHIEGLPQIKGKKLLLVKHDDLGATFLDSLSLKHLHQPYSRVFSHISYKEKQSELILGLFFKQAEVGIGDREMFNVMAEMNPQIRETLDIIADFPTKSLNYGFFHHDYPADLRDKISRTVIGFNHQARPQQILHELRMATLEACSVEELLPFNRLIADYRPLAKGPIR